MLGIRHKDRAHTHHQRNERPLSTTPPVFAVSPIPPFLSLVIIRACSALESRQGNGQGHGLTVFADMVDLNNEAPVCVMWCV